MAEVANFTVCVALPRGVSRARMRAYIEDEVRTNVGQLPAEDPLFELDRSSVVVTTARAPVDRRDAVMIDGVEWVRHLVNASAGRLRQYKEQGIPTRRRGTTTLVRQQDLAKARGLDGD